MVNNVAVLSTAVLKKQLMDQAAEAGIDLDAFPFIHTTAVTEKEVAEELKYLAALPLTAVFTSINAVNAVAEIIETGNPAWNIYCVGKAAAGTILKRFRNSFVMAMADDAATLAGFILGDGVQEVVFFCGNKRRDTLPDLLAAGEISAYEIIVYETIETPHVAAKAYDGILFFSPSEVSSFFKVNTIGPHTVLFAIGHTTEQAIKEISGNKVIVSKGTSKQEVVMSMIDYFRESATG
jgi:uroporphyrinogen-III synthase